MGLTRNKFILLDDLLIIMDNKDWLILDVYVDEPNKIEKILQNIERLVDKFKQQNSLIRFYFNKYVIPDKGDFYVKLGFYKMEENARKELKNELKKLETKNIRENAPDLNDVDGVTRDFIKCLCYELHKIIKEKLREKPTSQQMFYLIHLLMNQLGYNYQEELILYQNLSSNIYSELHKKQ